MLRRTSAAFTGGEYSSESQQLSRKRQAQLALKASFSLQLASTVRLLKFTQSLTRSLTSNLSDTHATGASLRRSRLFAVVFQNKNACGAKTRRKRYSFNTLQQDGLQAQRAGLPYRQGDNCISQRATSGVRVLWIPGGTIHKLEGRGHSQARVGGRAVTIASDWITHATQTSREEENVPNAAADSRAPKLAQPVYL